MSKHQLYISSVLTCIIIASFGCDNCSESEVHRKYNLANEKIEKREYSEGIRLLKSIRHCSNSDSLNCLIADAYFHNGKEEEVDSAVFYYGQALNLNRNYKRALFNLSALYNTYGNCDYSLPMLLHLEELDSNYIGLNNSIANAYSCLDSVEMELRYRIKAVIKDADLFKDDNFKIELIKARGIAYMRNKDFNSALQDYDFVLRHREDPEVYHKRGAVKMTLGDSIGGCNDFYKAVELKYDKAYGTFEKYCKEK